MAAYPLLLCATETGMHGIAYVRLTQSDASCAVKSTFSSFTTHCNRNLWKGGIALRKQRKEQSSSAAQGTLWLRGEDSFVLHPSRHGEPKGGYSLKKKIKILVSSVLTADCAEDISYVEQLECFYSD